MIVGIIQARLTSKRLSNKVLLNIYGQTVLEWVIHYSRKISKIDKLIILTQKEDKEIIEIAKRYKLDYFTQITSALLYNYLYCLRDIKPDWIVRICADAPFFNPEYTDFMLNQLCPDYNYYAYRLKGDEYPTVYYYPNGHYKEVFSYDALVQACLHARSTFEINNVTPYFYLKSHLNKILSHYIEIEKLDNTSSCLDYKKDIRKVKRIARKYYL